MNLLNYFKNTDDVRACASGEVIFADGDQGDSMYVVLEGEVEVSVGGVVLDTLGPGSLFGEMALIDARVRSATATAKSACRLAPVTEKRFLFMVQQTPFFALQVMRILAERLRRSNLRR